jgi:transcriptional regulator with XRE-family HTH domain
MARTALGLGIRELAEMAKVSPDTIARLERGETLRDRTIEDIKAALEAGGVIFVDSGASTEGGPGVRLKIFEDPARSARLRYHDEDLTYFTLQEAKVAWRNLPQQVRQVAVITTESGKSYNAEEIDRLYSRHEE